MEDQKIAIVFGAAGGIGRVVCQQLSAKGWQLFVAGRNAETLRMLAGQFPKAQFEVCDATQGEAVDSVFKSALAVGGRLGAIVNCVGSITLKPAHLTSEAEFRSVIDTNLLTAFHCVRNAGRHGSPGTSTVLVSSCAAKVGLANHEAIAAAKAGVEGLVRSAAATYAAKGLRFNAVAPGLVKTPLSEKITANVQAEAFSRSLHPLGRLGEPEDIASAIAYLVSEESSWVTGQILSVDGGLASVKLGK